MEGGGDQIEDLYKSIGARSGQASLRHICGGTPIP